MSKEDTFSRTPEKIDERIAELKEEYSPELICALKKRFTSENVVAFLEIMGRYKLTLDKPTTL